MSRSSTPRAAALVAQPARSECCRVAGRIDAGRRRAPLDDQRDGPAGQPGGDPAVAIDRAEHCAICNAGGLQPRPQRRDGAGRGAGGYHADDLTGSFLVRLAARDIERHAHIHEVEVGHSQRRQFRASQRRRQSDQHLGAVAPIDQAGGAEGDQYGSEGAVTERDRLALSGAVCPPDSLHHRPDRRMAGVHVVSRRLWCALLNATSYDGPTVDTRTQVRRLKAWTVLADVIAGTFMCAFG